MSDLYAGFTVEELKEAFNMVQNKQHWKGPIRAVVRCDERKLEMIRAAIMFYTATEAEVERLSETSDGVLYRIKAPGYWNGPAGP